MEDTLRDLKSEKKEILQTVLILVLMEDTLRDFRAMLLESGIGLNPCFNGRYSQRQSTG